MNGVHRNTLTFKICFMRKIKIIGTGVYVPQRCITSQQLEEYFAIQTSPLNVEISLKTSVHDKSKIQETVRKKLNELFQEHHVNPPNISFCPYNDLLGTKKLRRVERRFRIEE